MSSAATGPLPEGQQEALAVLRSIAQDSDGALTVDLDYETLGGLLTVRVYLASASLLPPGLDAEFEAGMKLEDWEPIDIHIPEDFPLTPPIAWTGRDDFPELPHKAEGSLFCVRVERNNWDSTAGIAGFLRAVIETYQRIALGTLQGHLQPWRPTADHLHYEGKGCAVIKADVPASHDGAENSLRWAAGIPVSDNRIDVTRWLDVNGTRPAVSVTEILSGQLALIKEKTPDAFLIPAVVTAKPMAVEYSEDWDDLLTMLEGQGFDRTSLLSHLARAATINQPPSGEWVQGAVLFRVAADTGPTTEGQDARFAVALLAQADVGLLLGMQAEDDDASADEFADAVVPWVEVYDGRPESVLRRAADGPAGKLAGARVLLLGCGGLGAPIAEHCVRSGAARLHIVDSGTVSPGVLSRQPYEDADIGQHKAAVLVPRLSRIRPESEITGLVADITAAVLLSESKLVHYDLVIDATANRSVAAVIERAQRHRHGPWPPLITVAISQRATHGVAAVTPRDAVGAGLDLLRRLGLRTCMSTALGDVYTAFFPPADGRLNFRPDPSCSDTTFIGSATDMAALAAQLLDAALARLDLRPGADGGEPPSRSLSIVRLGNGAESKAARVVLDLPPDRRVADHRQAYEVRIDETALETIREHVRASANGRTGGAGHTGGLLLGQFDSACRVAWVSQATGLPPGSSTEPLHMNLEAPEVRAFLADRSEQSEGMLTLAGFWRTQLGAPAKPSETDLATMRSLAAAPERRSAPALLLVLSVPPDGPAGEPSSPWPLEIHAETFPAGLDAPQGEENPE